MLFAAAGNSSGSTFCPSRSDKAVAIGFQLVHRFLDSALGGQWEPALASLPSYDQSVTVDFSVKQIEGALGSSFACPLAAGAAALGIRRVHLNELLQSYRYGSYADLFQASLGGRPTRDMVNATMSLYQLALSRNPLRDSSLDDPIDRLECAIFSVPLFINYGLMLMCTGNIPMAESLLRRARRFAPWDPNGAANLGRLCQLKAEEAINMATGFVSPIFYLKEAESLYVEALRLRPGMTIYEAQLAEIRRLMMRNPS
ncbi:MAG: hypothetical protein A2Y56_07070 [Candidatus Aminicenantes bacterium RBG_13_63_10]|nr:MAG: hypothetical protein A2Y56_07070 [Candidatus Aminicenantes bacterium RBG_13_63_10]